MDIENGEKGIEEPREPKRTGAQEMQRETSKGQEKQRERVCK